DVAALRSILDEMAIRLESGDLLGVSDLNSRLHALIQHIAGHVIAERLVASLNSQLVRFQYKTILLPGRSALSFSEHGAVVDAIAAGDGEAAETAMRTHLSHVVEALRASVTAPA